MHTGITMKILQGVREEVTVSVVSPCRCSMNLMILPRRLSGVLVSCRPRSPVMFVFHGRVKLEEPLTVVK